MAKVPRTANWPLPLPGTHALLTLVLGCSQYAMLVSSMTQSSGVELYLCSVSSLLTVSIRHYNQINAETGPCGK